MRPGVAAGSNDGWFHGTSEHEEHLGHLSERLNERRVRRFDFVQERVRERVIELQRNAEEKRPQNEDREVAIREQMKRVEAQCVADTERRASGFRRSMRKCERVQAEDDRRALPRLRFGPRRLSSAAMGYFESLI